MTLEDRLLALGNQLGADNQLLQPKGLPTGVVNKTGRRNYAERSVFNLKASSLRKTRAAQAKALAGTGIWDILFAGPSTVEGYPLDPSSASPPAHFLKLLQAAGYQAEPGWVPVTNNQGPGNTADPRWTFAGGFVNYTLLGKIPSKYSNSTNGATAIYQSKNSGTVAELLVTGAYGSFTLGVDDDSAAFSYTLNGGATVNVAAGAKATIAAGGSATTWLVIKITGLSDAAHKLLLTTTSTTSVFISKARVYHPTGSMLVTNQGFGGSRLLDWDTTTDSNDQFSLQPLSVIGGTPHTVILNVDLWMNDFMMASWTSTQVQAALTRIVQQYQARGCEVVLWMGTRPHPTVGFSTYPAIPDATYLAVRQVVYDIAVSLETPLVDATDRKGTWAEANTNGLMTDQVHGNSAGYAVDAFALMEAISPVVPGVQNPPRILDANASTAAKNAFYGGLPNGTVVFEYIP